MKYGKIALLLLMCLALLLVPAAAEEKGAETGYIGIISAMDSEVQLLLGNAEIGRTEQIGGVDFHIGTLRGQNVVIAKAGIGKVLAASGATAMLCSYPVSAVIFTGVAGGVGDETQMLDMVIAERLVQHDYGAWNQDGFEWTVPTGQETGYYDCDAELVNTACAAAKEIAGEEHTFRGLIATGDQFVASEAYVKKLQEEFGAIACEMEGASVALTCMQFGVPYVVIRCMSDKADGNAYDTYENFVELAADRSGQIVMRMLETLQKP